MRVSLTTNLDDDRSIGEEEGRAVIMMIEGKCTDWENESIEKLPQIGILEQLFRFESIHYEVHIQKTSLRVVSANHPYNCSYYL